MFSINQGKISAICFGIMNSNSLSASIVYKLTNEYLFADKTNSFWSSRFTKNGYIFSGDKLDIDENVFKEISPLLTQVPTNIFETELPGISDPGNKDEFAFFIQIDTSDGKTVQFKIDENDDTNRAVDKRILDFMGNIKAVINKIEG